MGILENVLREPGVCMTNPTQVREYLRLWFGGRVNAELKVDHLGVRRPDIQNLA